MSRIKNYAATIADAGDGAADMDLINSMEVERAYKEYELNKLKEELNESI